MDIIWLICGLLLGLAVGGVGGVLLTRRGGHTTGGPHAQQVAAARAEAARLSERLSAEAEAHQRELAAAERAADERADLQQAARERELAAEQRRAAAERVAELEADTRRISDENEGLSAQRPEPTSTRCLEQAEHRWELPRQQSEAELAKREEAVRHLVEPLTRTLGEVKQEMTTAEKERLSAHAALSEQVQAMRSTSEHLRTETSQLVSALRAPQVRGRWGELQLRNVVESAGMVEHVDFVEQATYQTDDGPLRPDLVVTLPGEKHVVVDAKVAFNGYLEAMDASDEQVRAKRFAVHALHVREHIDSLGSKSYWEHVPHTPEFVVMFLPAEVFLNAALEEDPSLLERAFAQDVVLATPATLVALLRTVAYTWRQERLAEDAQQVFTVGRELHKRLGTLGKHLTTLGKRLNSTVEAYNAFNASLDSQLVTQARRFSALQGLEPNLAAPPPLEVLAVPAQKEDVHGVELTTLVDRAAQDADRAARDPHRAGSGDSDVGPERGTGS